MHRAKKYLLRGAAWLTLLVILLGAGKMAALTLPYTALKPGVDFLQTKVFVYHILPWRLSFYVHVFTGVFALLAGAIQFSGYIIAKWPRLHRLAGYTYVINVLLITGPAALIMSFYANGGWLAKTSFIIQSLAWLLSTAIALQCALKKKFAAHGAWMLRSYALTLAALTLRSYAAILSLIGTDMRPVDKYTLIAWASWVPNLIFAEMLIRSGFIARTIHQGALENRQTV